MLQRGIRYDKNYQGTGYRKESDLPRQIKALGLKIIFEPRFFAYHLAVETGGNRYSDLQDRIYWKWKNHTYFMNKWHYLTSKKILSYVILTIYAYAKLYGFRAVALRYANVVGPRLRHGVVWDFTNKLLMNSTEQEILVEIKDNSEV